MYDYRDDDLRGGVRARGPERETARGTVGLEFGTPEMRYRPEDSERFRPRGELERRPDGNCEY